MKTHIIHLERYDNVISITDKLSWGKTKRVLLVYPPSKVLILQRIDLLMIQRAAKKMGFSIGLVSRSKGVRKLAGELNIPVFKSIKAAQRRTWMGEDPGKKKNFERKPLKDLRSMGQEAKLKEPEWKSHIGVRLSFFSLGVLAVLVLSLLFVPSAVIHLKLSDRMQSISMLVEADEKVAGVNLSGKIPAHTISVDVEGSRLVKIISKTKVPDKFATGIITFTNLTETEVVIPAGTIVTRLDNAGIRFETIEKGELVARIGEAIDLPVRALTPGEAGNMEANSLGSLVGDLGTSLLVTNPTPTIGGTDRFTTMATKSDRSDLFSSLETELRLNAIQKALVFLPEGDIIFPDTLIIGVNLQENYVPAAGQPGDSLSLYLKLSYSMQYAEYSDLIRVAEPAINADLPAGFEPIADSTMNIEILKKPTTNPYGITNLNLIVSQKIREGVDTVYLSRLVQGLSVQEAYRILEKKFGQDTKPVIEIAPSWWPRLPIVALRIVISN
ncbi:MAG: hypothetical protein A2X25_13625 [Chloroflexi bacterium GWB2_49_20]|nr:MAG: hypothetical protein A2X25_13625 [Chloroflexi bacterium GWB2_49_20]OGN79979.1 MAG: hypothetical protein A2X26_03125 [Chloroflexi bacterium GWC2_49_37]OGN85485.1 MAG: hypothetical protein A2X27_03935 [Chloroflexi bacterium GWD2_49_16]HBG74354.1 hypothetical protein [Anaerolineae bacterium]HCM97036.1 hypothetical protein [Anaerolineae bacterium]